MSQNPAVSTDRRIGTLPTLVAVQFAQPNVQSGESVGTTDGSGNLTVTFPNAFSAAPTSIVVTVSGADNFARLVSKTDAQFVVQILGTPNTLSALSDVAVSSTLTALTSFSAPTTPI